MISYFRNRFFTKKKNPHNPYSNMVSVDPTAIFSPSAVVNRQNDKEKIIVGKHARIFGTLLVFKTGKIEIGDYSLLNQNSYLSSTNYIKIGDRVLISWNVSVFDNNSHPLNAKERHVHFLNPDADVHIPSSPTVIEDDVWIGCNCIILKGVTIGKGSVISAGSVVTKSIPANSIVAGNPAEVVKNITNA